MVCTFMLGSCSKIFEVDAIFINGKLAFVGDDNEKTFSPWCLNNFTVSDQDGEKMWEIDTCETFRNAKECGPNLPIFYGEGPKGAKIIVPAKPLIPGRIYVIDGLGGGLYEGVFQYIVQRVTKVENLDRDDPKARAIITHMFDARRERDQAIIKAAKKQ